MLQTDVGDTGTACGIERRHSWVLKAKVKKRTVYHDVCVEGAEQCATYISQYHVALNVQ